MIRALILSAALISLPAMAQSTGEGRSDSTQRGSAPTPADRGSSAESSQRGSMGSTAGGSERTATPGAGLEAGEANGMAGGRTDEGPMGGTGIRGTLPPSTTRARANAADQARGRNPKGSFERPADSPAQMNRHPVAMGSGAPQVPVSEQPEARGGNYGPATKEGRAGGIASGEGNPSGASPEGPDGKSHQTQPLNHSSEAGR